MKCSICGREFKPSSAKQICCSLSCAVKMRFNHAKVKKPLPPPKKTLEQWCTEADQCNLDYGTYRALIELGKTFDELKAQNHVRQIHAHGKPHRTGCL